MEVWDAYKENGTLAGVDLIKGENLYITNIDVFK